MIEKYNEILLGIDTLENKFYNFEIQNANTQKLQNYIKFEKGKKPTKITSFGVKYLTIDSLENNEITYTNCAKTLKCDINDVLMVMDGASSGKVYIGAKGAVGSTLALINCHSINKYYLYIFLKNNYSSISDRNTGSAIPHANKEFVLDLDIPLNKIDDKVYNQILEYKIVIKNSINRLACMKKLYLNKFFN